MSLPAVVDVVVQMGHVDRQKGATGTDDKRRPKDASSGYRGSEKDFVKLLGPMIRDRLVAANLTVDLIGADDKRRPAEVFLALHQDGSESTTAHGASTGFPIHGDGETLSKIWKARMAAAGWPFGFRRSNYTIGERFYYAFGGLRRWWWKRAKFDSALLIEHGFATTPTEQDWVWDHLEVIAGVDADTIIQYLKNPAATERTGPMDLSMGAESPAVKQLQKLLNMFGQSGLEEDGDFGPKTRNAVIAYQSKLKVPATGVWGPASVTAHHNFVTWLAAQPATKPTPTPPTPPPTPVPTPAATVAVPVVELDAMISQLQRWKQP